MARASCYACHSNETDWPLYSYVAPMSWLVRSDVENGRDELNFSDWDRDAGEADDAVEAIESGAMPPDRYTLIHRDASLSDEERDVLVVRAARHGGRRRERAVPARDVIGGVDDGQNACLRLGSWTTTGTSCRRT